MTSEEWKELDELGMMKRKQMFPKQKKRMGELLKKTEKVFEHPEDYDGPCSCQLCMSYGDD